MRRSSSVAIFILVLGVLAFTVFGGGDIDGQEARRLVAAGARLVDVRTVGEFKDGHIDGAINVPVQDLDARIKALEPKDRAIVVYCRSGQRSGRAARALREAGFKAVHDLGPMSRW